MAHPNGAVTPAETPSVVAAKAAHFAAKGLPVAAPALAYNGYNAYAAGYAYNGYPYAAGYAYNALPYAAGYNGLVAHPNGAVVPVDEPAVQAKKAEHFAAKGLPLAAAPAVYAGAYAGAYAGYPYAAGYALPYAAGYQGLVAHPNGAVVPVDEPAVAAAKAEHFAAKGLPLAPVAPLAYAAQPGLTVHPNGAVVPVESPEILAARAEHLAHF